MNKFFVAECIDVKEDDYKGPAVILACCSDPSLVLVFPIDEQGAATINFVLDEKNKYDIDTSVIGIYKTMVDSWKASDRYLAGVILDVIYDKKSKEDVLIIRLALSDSDGDLDSLVHVNFLHGVFLAAMERTQIVICDKLLAKMIPDFDDENVIEKETPHFPEDKKIVDIAKKIMSGKIKDK